MYPLLRRYDYVPSMLVFCILILSVNSINCVIVDEDHLNSLAINESTQVPIQPVVQQESTTTTTTTTTPSTTTTTTTQNPEDLKKVFTGSCFHSDEELCNNREVIESNSRSCDCYLHPQYKKALFCCNVTDIDKALNCANANLTDLQHLHIRNANIDEIDFSGKS